MIYTKEVETDLHFIKYGAFAQLSKTYLNNRLVSSLGLRIDGNSFTNNTTTPNFSPCLSLAYNLTEKASINASLESIISSSIYDIRFWIKWRFL